MNTVNLVEKEIEPSWEQLIRDLGGNVYPMFRRVILNEYYEYDDVVVRRCIRLINRHPYHFLNRMKDLKKVIGELYDYIFEHKIAFFHIYYNQKWLYTVVSSTDDAIDKVKNEIYQFCKDFRHQNKSKPDETPVYNEEVLDNIESLQNVHIIYDENGLQKDVTDQFSLGKA